MSQFVKLMEIQQILHDGTIRNYPIEVIPPEMPDCLYTQEDFKMGIMISTYASTPYVELALKLYRQQCKDIAILVHDDNSPERDQLAAVCKKYDADFESTSISRGHTIGDLTSFYGGLTWAYGKAIDLLVKFSRRFIPYLPWDKDLRQIALLSQAPTFSSVCMHEFLGFRTEAMAMHVPSWVNHDALGQIREQLTASFLNVEAFIHRLSKEVDKSSRSVLYNDYLKTNGRPDWCAGYVEWTLLGYNRKSLVPGVLWHHSNSAREYWEISEKLGLSYSLKDFTVKDSHHFFDTLQPTN